MFVYKLSKSVGLKMVALFGVVCIMLTLNNSINSFSLWVKKWCCIDLF